VYVDSATNVMPLVEFFEFFPRIMLA
jgi:hypothetical protein